MGNLGYLVAAEELGSSKARQLLAQDMVCRKHNHVGDCMGTSERAPELGLVPASS